MMIPIIVPVDKETYDSMCVDITEIIPSLGEATAVVLLMIVWAPVWYFAIDWFKDDPGWFMRWPIVNSFLIGLVSLYSSLATMILRLLK